MTSDLCVCGYVVAGQRLLCVSWQHMSGVSEPLSGCAVGLRGGDPPFQQGVVLCGHDCPQVADGASRERGRRDRMHRLHCCCKLAWPGGA